MGRMLEVYFIGMGVLVLSMCMDYFKLFNIIYYINVYIIFCRLPLLHMQALEWVTQN